MILLGLLLLVKLFLCLFCRFEIKYNPINTIAQSCRFWAIFKNMTQMCFASAALYLCTLHSICVIRCIDDGVFADRFVKAGPSAAAFKLCIAAE